MLLYLPFTDGALKDHFGKVDLDWPPLSVAVKVLCLQHVREVECQLIQGCEVSISVRCSDDAPLIQSLFHHTRTLYILEIVYSYL